MGNGYWRIGSDGCALTFKLPLSWAHVWLHCNSFAVSSRYAVYLFRSSFHLLFESATAPLASTFYPLFLASFSFFSIFGLRFSFCRLCLFIFMPLLVQMSVRLTSVRHCWCTAAPVVVAVACRSAVVDFKSVH